MRGSSRTSSGRKPGKQSGQPGSTMPLVDDPDEIIVCDPDCCTDCGAALTGAVVCAMIVLELLPNSDAASTFRPPAPAAFAALIAGTMPSAPITGCIESSTPRTLAAS